MQAVHLAGQTVDEGRGMMQGAAQRAGLSLLQRGGQFAEVAAVHLCQSLFFFRSGVVQSLSQLGALGLALFKFGQQSHVPRGLFRHGFFQLLRLGLHVVRRRGVFFDDPIDVVDVRPEVLKLLAKASLRGAKAA